MLKSKGLIVFKQLVKEFWIPFVIAILWCIYNFSGRNASPVRFPLLLNCFGAAFFFVSWLLSQYFRVRKQTKVDNDLQSIHENVSSVVKELKEASKDMIGYQTGGDSYCYLINSSMAEGSNIGIETVIHQGKHPLFDVSARIVDLDELDIEAKVEKISFDTFLKVQRAYNNIIPGHVHMGKKWDLGDVNQRRFNVFWTARNGGFIQCLRFKKIDDQWHHAIKVIRDEKELYSYSSERYPRNGQGEIEW